ncbi:hypothetical protein C8R44DRAFT_875131 [Mycena epipterygia]|nr:hypothetical protein C8R44DRAFT_875131 [Mycena epipterygia]
MSQALIFPPELVEVVIEQIDSQAFIEEIDTSIILVSREFAGPCQRRLFHTLALHIDLAPDPLFSPPLKTFKRAQSVLTSSPHLAHHVRELVMHITPQSMSSERTLLEKFTIVGGAGFDSVWSHLPAELLPLFWRVIQRPSLHSFRLIDIIGVPRALLHYAATSFSQLSINHTSFYINDPYPHVRRSPDPPFLTLRQGASSVEHITILLLPAILEGDDMCAVMLRDDMQRALRNFDWWFHALAPQITLPLLPALRFELDLGSASGPRHWTHRIEAVLATVNVPTSSPILKWLRIVIRGFYPESASSTWPTPIPWPPFDTPHYVQSLTRLREVQCRLENAAHQFSLDTFVGYMEAIFPGPREAGMLSFETSRHRDIW